MAKKLHVCPRCGGTGRERSKEHTTRCPCWGCGGSGLDLPLNVKATPEDQFAGAIRAAGEGDTT